MVPYYGSSTHHPSPLARYQIRPNRGVLGLGIFRLTRPIAQGGICKMVAGSELIIDHNSISNSHGYLQNTIHDDKTVNYSVWLGLGSRLS